jgi:phospholipid-binding lipoprotein MlaA
MTKSAVKESPNRHFRVRHHLLGTSGTFPPLAIFVLMLGIAASQAAAAAEDDQNDPFERTNRTVFEMNARMDKAVARPVAKFYVSAVPKVVRTGLHNVLTNLGKPVTLGNDLLQGEGKRAGETLTRLVTNSTLGLGGLIDVATMAGVPDHAEDFGQTLGVWGAGEGPYLMLPLMGPSNPRDLTGDVADFFMDPLTYAHFDYENLAMDTRIGLGLLDLRASNLDTTDQIERTSLDFYATTRSLYRQYRKSEIANGNADAPETPDGN